MTDSHPPSDLSSLAAFLADEPPAGLARVEQAAVDDLVRMCRDAQAQQVAQIARAIDEALRLVPRPLRGMVKRVIMS